MVKLGQGEFFIMANTITEDKLNAASAEFSDLAWRFNNLNSTAKMLLVGTNSQSVPFIPISELAYETTPIQKNNSLSLSSLAGNPEITKENPSANIYLKPVEPKASTLQNELETNQVYTAKEQSSNTAIIADSPNIAPPQNKPENLPFAPIYTSSVLIPEKKEPEIIPAKEPETDKSSLETIDSVNNIESWSYRRPYLEDEYAEEIRQEEFEENRKESFWGPFLRTTGVVSVLALICAGAFYFVNNKKPKEDPLLEELSQTQSETNNATENNSLSSSESLSSVNNSINSNDSANKTFVDESPTQTDSGYYQPKIETKPKQTQTKAKVYKSPKVYASSPKKINTSTSSGRVQSGYPYYPNASTKTNSPVYSAEEKFIPVKPAPLFDPSTIYDSTATSAINPETYTAEEFPLEVSYTKESPQFEAAFVPPNSKTQNINTFNEPPIENTVEDETNGLTDEEKQIMPENSSVPVYNQPIQQFNNNSSQEKPTTSVPLYSKPINSSFEEEPVLRKPVQSSSNIQTLQDETFGSPYKQAENLTTTMPSQQVVQDAPKAPIQRKTSFFRRKKYSQEYKQEAAQNNANSALNAYQDRLREIQRKAEGNNLSETERSKLLGEIEVLKTNISQTQKELDETTQLINKSSSPYQGQNLNEVESDANKVYLKPNFDEEADNNSSLDIGYL